MPDGYRIPEFVKARFGGNAVAGGVVVLGALFGKLSKLSSISRELRSS